MTIDINNYRPFSLRHNGPSKEEIDQMLKVVVVESLDQLVNETIPKGIRLEQDLTLPGALSEHDFLRSFAGLMKKNKIYKSFIGLGYYNCHLPLVIQRNILENPGWYTAYTPYQAEIAQGRLEALINFQTMVTDLTSMEIANASLLDEGTAAAEAMSMLFGMRRGDKKSVIKFFVHDQVFPHTLDILKTRYAPFGVELVIWPLTEYEMNPAAYFVILIQYPDSEGGVTDHE